MITPELKQVILAALKLDDWDIQDHTQAPEIPGWDSLSHVGVISEVEKHYGVRFSNREVLQLKNIGELQRLVNAKTDLKAN